MEHMKSGRRSLPSSIAIAFCAFLTLSGCAHGYLQEVSESTANFYNCLVASGIPVDVSGEELIGLELFPPSQQTFIDLPYNVSWWVEVGTYGHTFFAPMEDDIVPEPWRSGWETCRLQHPDWRQPDPSR
ncbi:MAG: hypothetical protein LBB58_06645 [Cellulomonadaceae bacterium]|jgi:hypothetical protein|nr:hypothetical protein [Cellulomonadaceae bacterium]